MNDDTQTNGPAMNGDDELAKTLKGGLKFEEAPIGDNSSVQGPMAIDDPSSSTDDTPPSIGTLPHPVSTPDGTADVADNDKPDHESTSSAPTSDSSDLEKLKSSALDDLKPLVGKLNLSPEEKFDTLLLIIRSTDDQGLLAEAHSAAKEIGDDTKRAQALLDIIKEVDYFNGKNN